MSFDSSELHRQADGQAPRAAAAGSAWRRQLGGAKELSMALLLITHDLGVVADHADRVAVMLAGRKVEEARTADIFARPRHAYTRGLLGASLNRADDLHYRVSTLPEIRHDTPSGGEAVFTLVPRAARWISAPAQPVAAPAEAPARQAAPLLAVEALSVEHAQRHAKTALRAVDDVSFEIARGESVGLVGESGCGKSTLSRAIMRLAPVSRGAIRRDGTDLVALGERALRPLRRKVQMVFQDPYASPNPRRTVAQILPTVLRVNGVRDARERDARVRRIVERVRLPSAALARYPHEFSGGQRQRIGIARALVLEPDLLICDEPVSALDVSIQAQILNLLVELKQELGLSLLFISHDLSVVRYIADRVHVMQRAHRRKRRALRDLALPATRIHAHAARCDSGQNARSDSRLNPEEIIHERSKPGAPASRTSYRAAVRAYRRADSRRRSHAAAQRGADCRDSRRAAQVARGLLPRAVPESRAARGVFRAVR